MDSSKHMFYKIIENKSQLVKSLRNILTIKQQKKTAIQQKVDLQNYLKNKVKYYKIEDISLFFLHLLMFH